MATTVASLQAVLDLDKSKFDTKIGEVGQSFDKLMTGLAGGAALGGIAAAGGALVATGKAAFEMQRDIDAATRLSTKQLGLTEKEAEEFEDTMVGIFRANFGESFEEVAGALVTVRQGLKNVDEDEVSDLTKQALVLSDVFDQDIGETVRTADKLMKNMGLSGSEAMDLITAGFQTGADVNGDLLDTLNEYSDDFGRLGLKGDEALGLINAGLDAGILNTDKIGDLINEFGINLRDPAVLAAIGDVDEGLGGIVEQFQSGQIGEREAFEGIIAGLQDVDSEIAQDQAGVLLFRSLWEDLGAEAVLALGNIEEKAQDVGSAADTLKEQYGGVGGVFQGLQRQVLTALEPITGEISRQIDELLPQIQAFGEGSFTAVDPFVQSIADLLRDTDALQTVFDSVNQELAFFGPIIETVLTPLGALITLSGQVIGFFEKIDEILESSLNREFDTFSSIFGTVLQIATSIVLPFTSIVTAIQDIRDLLPEVNEAWKTFSEVTGIDNLVDYLRPGSPTPLEAGLRGINSALQDLPDMSGGLVTGGATMTNTTVNIGGVSATSTGGDANNEAIRLTLQILRSQLEAAG